MIARRAAWRSTLYRITLRTEGEAFQPEPSIEVARILQTLAARLLAGQPITGAIQDANGNHTGAVLTGTRGGRP